MKNIGNTSSENSFNTEFSRKIEKLLKMEKGTFAQQVEKKGENKAILDILHENPGHEKLHTIAVERDWGIMKSFKKEDITEEVAQAALKQSIGVLRHLPEKIKSNITVAKSVINAQIKAGQNFLEIEKYLYEYFSDGAHHNELIKYYLRMQKVSGTLARNDLTRYLVTIKETEFYKHLKKEKIIRGIGKYIKPDNSFIKNFLKSVEVENIDELSDKEKHEKFLQLFIQLIGKEKTELSDEESLVFEKILEICIQEYNKKFNPESQEDNNNDKEDNGKGDYLEDDDFEEYSPEEKLDYCYPTRSYTISESGNYSVKLGYERELKISKNEMKQASVVALENYAKFYETLCEMGLEFLWKQKYRSGFTTACTNKFGLNYLAGEGITSSKLLSTLNFIAKNIGIPEEEYEDREGNKEIGCFKEISSAKIVFRDIKNTGIINNRVIDTAPGKSKRGTVEKYMIQTGLIDDDGGLNMSEWT